MRQFLMILAVIFAQTNAFAAISCGANTVSVVAPPDFVSRTCLAVDAAIAHLGKCDLWTPLSLEIHVTEEIKGTAQDCLGVFHCGEERIDVLTPDAMVQLRKETGLFAHLTPDRLFDAVILHEMAHAVYDRTICPYGTCLATSEYFAYTVQISSFSEEERKPFETRLNDGTRIRRDMINAIILMMAPDKFVQVSWAHFQGRPEPCAYWKSILSGATVFDHPHP